MNILYNIIINTETPPNSLGINIPKKGRSDDPLDIPPPVSINTNGVFQKFIEIGQILSIEIWKAGHRLINTRLDFHFVAVE